MIIHTNKSRLNFSIITILLPALITITLPAAFSAGSVETGNYEKLVSRIDLTRPVLSDVKKYAEQKDYKSAAAAFIKHLQSRKSPVASKDRQDIANMVESKDFPGDAEAALQNRFVGQRSYGLVKVPDDIPWDYNPTKNDPEWTWQFNRHYGWHALSRTYYKTQNEKYAEKWVSLMLDWITETWPPQENRYAWRTIECGGRVRRWALVYLDFVNSPSVSLADHVAFLNSWHDQINFLLPGDTMLKGARSGNIGLILMNGLLEGAKVFPEFEDSKLWLKTAADAYQRRIKEEVYDDGAQKELTTSYHFHTMYDFVRAGDTLEQLGYKLPGSYWKKVEKMHEYGLFVAFPDVTLPAVGDSDRDILHGLTGVLNEGAKRFDRSDMLYVATKGRAGQKPDYSDTALPQAGYYAMRTSWTDPNGIYLFCDAARSWGGGHSDYDALHIDLYACGSRLIDDLGKYTYARPERQIAAKTSSHSTVVVDDKNQNKTPAELNCFCRKGALSFLDVRHNGYDGITHRRQILFARPADNIEPYFIIIDRIAGEGSHVIDNYFHFSPGSITIDEEALSATVMVKENAGLLTKAIKKAQLNIEPVHSFISYHYNEKTNRPAVRFRKKVELPTTFVTLLLPFSEENHTELNVTEIENAGQTTIAVKVQGRQFTDIVFAAIEPELLKTDFFSGTGYAGLIRFDKDGKQIRKDLVNGFSDSGTGIKGLP